MCLLLWIMLQPLVGLSQNVKTYTLLSPNGKLQLQVTIGKKISWSASHQTDIIIAPSTISLQLQSGEVLGNDAIIVSSKTTSINETFKAINYKKDSVKNNCNEFVVTLKGNYSITFRAYNDGVAYHFSTAKKDSFIVEERFVFDNNYPIEIGEYKIEYDTDLKLFFIKF